MHIDVVDILRLHAGVVKSHLHGEFRSESVGMCGCQVICVGRHAAANYFCVDLRAACFCVFKLFKNKNCRAFAHHEAVA